MPLVCMLAATFFLKGSLVPKRFPIPRMDISGRFVYHDELVSQLIRE